MSNNRAARPTGLGQRRIWVAIVAVLVVAALASAAAAAIRGATSPESRQQADVGRSEQAIPSDPATPPSSPEPSPTSAVPTSAAPASSAPPGAGQPASAPAPRITSFSATANGLIVTITFTLAAQSDRGPFTCNVRRAAMGTEEFPCTVGQVSRTYDYDYCCGGEVHITATDRHGVRSNQWDGWVDMTRPDPPTYSNVRGWHDGSTVHIEFDVTAAIPDATSL